MAVPGQVLEEQEGEEVIRNKDKTQVLHRVESEDMEDLELLRQ
jgi:hypothetical protein